MASIDKAAIGFSIAIIAVGAGFAFYMGGIQDAGPVVSAPLVSAPVVSKTIEPKTQADPFADIVSKVKESSVQEEPVVKQEQKPVVKQEQKPVVKQEQKPVVKQEQKPVVKQEMAKTGPKTVTVEIPAGTSVPGCESTNECYIPESVTINVGDTVKWNNVDTAAHTVTGGSPADGPSGVFDSSLVMGGATFAYTFDEAGNYDYFCMVHPWMIGDVQVN
jgi:plastocyanin